MSGGSDRREADGSGGVVSSREGRPRWGRRVAVGVGVVVVGLLVYSAVDWYRVRQVWPDVMPALSEPAPMLPPAPDGEALLRAAGALRAAVEVGSEARKAVLAAEGGPEVPGDGWPEDVAAGQAAVDALVALSGVRLAPVRLDGPGLDVFVWLRLGELRQVRALRRFVEGDVAGAWGDVASVVGLAQRVSHAGGNLMAAMVGAAIEQGALRTAGRLLAAGGWHDGAGAVAAELAAAAGRRSPLVGALAGECLGADALYAEMGERSLDELMAVAEMGVGPGGAGGEPGVGVAEGKASGQEKGTAGGTWLYNADATRALAREHCIAVMAAVGQPAQSRVLPVAPVMYSGSWWRPGELLDNPIGRILLSIASVDGGRYAARFDRLAAERARVRVALAKAGFAAARGEAAGDIEALVPEWLDAVPIDALSGERLTLDPEPLPAE